MCEWRVDQRGDHRLAGQIDARGAGRRLHLAPAPDAREAVVLDQERRVFDRRAAVAGDEAGAFEQGRGGGGPSLSRSG